MPALAADQINPHAETRVVEITPEKPRPQNRIRRFSIADLSGWVERRLVAQFPHIKTQSMSSFVYQLISDNDCSFLYQEHAVALAQFVRPHVFGAVPVIHERFVWAEDPSNRAHLTRAAEFYTEWKNWATRMGVDVLIVMENTDVFVDSIEKRLGTLRKKPQTFARI